MDRRRLIVELEALYRNRYRQFLRVAIAVVRDETAAHDVVQEGFARAIKSADSYRGDGTLEAWLWHVVLNTARAARRDAPAGPLADETLGAVNGRSIEDDTGLRTWIAALPERQRLAIFLRYYADLDYRSIASALGVEIGTVSATLSTAHAALRRSLKEVSQ